MTKINYRLDENNIIIFWTRAPFDENLPHLELADGIEIHAGFDKVIDGVLVQDTEAYSAAAEARHAEEARFVRIAELKKLLADSDYQCLKHADGELTDEEYESIRAQRHAWRVEINELEA